MKLVSFANIFTERDSHLIVLGDDWIEWKSDEDGRR